MLQVDASAMKMGTRTLLLAGIVAALMLTVAIVLAGYLEPDYSHMAQFVSELGAVGAAHQNILNYGGLFPSGLLTALFSVGLYSRLGPRASFVACSSLVALAGIGRLVAGLFPCDPGCGLVVMSMPARIHALAGFVALVSGALAPMLLAFGLRGHRQGILFGLSLWLGTVSLLLVVLLFGLGPGAPYIGAIQRLVLAAFYAWVVSVAVKIDSPQQGVSWRE